MIRLLLQTGLARQSQEQGARWQDEEQGVKQELQEPAHRFLITSESSIYSSADSSTFPHPSSLHYSSASFLPPTHPEWGEPPAPYSKAATFPRQVPAPT